MNNSKSEAAYHGRPRAFLVGDWVYVTRLPEYDHRLGRVVKIQDSLLPYVVQIEGPEHPDAVNRAFDWTALTPVGVKGAAAYRLPSQGESTGDHVQAKLADDLYQDWDADDQRPLTFKRTWVPTPAELGMACGIVALIIFIFCFVVIFYRM